MDYWSDRENYQCIKRLKWKQEKILM